MLAPLVVPDASVILKWVLPGDEEPDTQQALLLREAIANEDIRIWVPSLWLYEVGNTIARRFPDQAERCLKALITFELDEYPSSHQWLTVILKLTRQYQVTFYDAAYHAIALIERGTFVTADVRYANRVSSVGAIMLLSDWTLS